MKKQWTKEEIHYLEINAKKGITLSKMAKDLNRTDESIIQKAKKLKINLNQKKRHWTKEELEQFEEKWLDETISNDCLMRHFHRTWKALQVRANLLQLGPRYEDSSYLTIQDICVEMNVNDDKLYHWIQLGLKTHKGNSKKRKYLIDTNDLLSFLEQHPSFYDASEISSYLFYEEPKWLKDKRKDDFDNKQFSKKKGIEWTNEEDKLLLMLNDRTLSTKEIAIRLGRSECAIINRLSILGVKRRKQNAYKKEEIQILQKYSRSKTLQELQQLLPNRTISSIRYKCKDLKLPYHSK